MSAIVRGRRIKKEERKRFGIFFFEQSTLIKEEKRKKKFVVAPYREDAKASRARVFLSACRASPEGGAKL